MKRLIIFAVVLALCCLMVPTAQGAPAAYTVQPNPDFALIGTNVTFMVSGTPLSYVFLMVSDGTGNTTLADRFEQLDYQGLASVNVTIPADAAPGMYTASVLVDGQEVANCTIEVVYDFETWGKARISEMNEEIADEKNATMMLRQELADLRAWNEQVMMLAYICAGFALFTTVYVWANRKDWRDYNWSAIKRAQSFGDQIKQQWYMITHPRPEGEGTVLHPGMMARMEEMRKYLRSQGKPVKNAFVVIPSSDPAQESRVMSLETLEFTPVDAPVPMPAPAPTPMPMKAPEPAKEPRRPLFGRRPEPRPQKPKRMWREPTPAVPQKGRFNLFGRKKDELAEGPKQEVIIPDFPVIEEKTKPTEEEKPKAVTKKPPTRKKSSTSSTKKKTTKPKTETKPAEGTQ